MDSSRDEDADVALDFCRLHITCWGVLLLTRLLICTVLKRDAMPLSFCKALSMCADTSDLEGPAAIAIPMLSLRIFVNAFRGGSGSLQAIASQLEPVLRCNEKFINSKNKNIRLSAATLLYNISFYVFSKEGVPSVIGSQVVLQVDMILKSKVYETEALIRSMVALGTVVMTSPEAKETAKSAFVVSRVEMSASSHGDLAKAVAREVYNVIS